MIKYWRKLGTFVGYYRSARRGFGAGVRVSFKLALAHAIEDKGTK